ncbi:MAG: hypothetical protein IPQ07_15130 [Myxococcales bacterium]|nr:hypothetical protein [Myxococcales bacterium]
MGSKLAILAAGLTLSISTPRLANAEPSADELAKQGIEAYKTANYALATKLLTRSYELSKKPDTLFALAQAERLDGNCTLAVEHYKKLLAQTSEINAAKLIQTNLALCEKHEPVVVPPSPPPETVKPAPAPAPAPVATTTKTIVRGPDHLAIAVFAGGALGLGVGTGLYIAANGAADDAKHAGTLDAFHEANDRSDRDRALSYVAFGVGAGLVGYAIFRWVSAPTPRSTEVALTPTEGGSTVWVRGSW